MWRSCLVVAGGLGLLTGTATAQIYDMARGNVTVDGVISPGEWDHAYWMDMDQVYYGNPVDLGDASWAALWNETENAIYVAVVGTDTSHVMHAHTAWDGQDCLEFYVNARNDDISDYLPRYYDYAQQYRIGWDEALGSLFVVMGAGDPVPPAAQPEMAFDLTGNRLTYEFKLRPFDVFDYSNVTASTEIPLSTGMVVGVDVLLNSRTVGGGFGVLCENAMPQKDTDAGSFLDHRLLPPPPPPGLVLIIKGKRPW